MKRFGAISFVFLLVISTALSGCSEKTKSTLNNSTVTPKTQKNSEVTKAPEVKTIKVWSYAAELPNTLKKFKELHPDFGYDIEAKDLSNAESSYQVLLDEALAAGGAEAPDIYGVDSSFAIKYTQGDAYQYASDYKDLGIDVDKLLKETSIAQYVIDMGTNPDGKLVGLGYQSTGGAFIYRRSIAKDVWGTEDPSKIKAIIGPGWDKFFSAAAVLKAKGYGICSAINDIWQPVFNSADQGWVVDGKLVIDSKREQFIDLAMKLKKNGYTNNTQPWTDGWFNDMKDGGKKKIFGFFGPAWLINYVMIAHSGGEKVGKGTYGDWAVCEPSINFFQAGSLVLANKNTKPKTAVGEIIKWLTLDSSETGLQYLWANDKLGLGAKDSVSSSTVMKKSDGKMDFLGGQNLFDVYIPATQNTNGKNLTKYDESINTYWVDEVKEYVNGKKSREKAIADFKQQVKDNLDIDIE